MAKNEIVRNFYYSPACITHANIMVSWMHYKATDQRAFRCIAGLFFLLSCLHCARVLLIRFKGIFSFFHLCSMTDSCLLICVHECLQYPHYLHMIIVTINLRCRFLFYLPSVCEFSKFVYKIHNLNAWLEFFVRWISRKK